MGSPPPPGGSPGGPDPWGTAHNMRALARTPIEIDPYRHDPLQWGASMAQHHELLLRCLHAVSAGSVVEVGAYAGDLTRALVGWARECDGRVIAIDPSPQDQLVALAADAGELELIRQTSLQALREVRLPDVIIIDGDHNYYTVAQELTLIRGRAGAGGLPLLLLHDVGWPHGRRDDYFEAQQIPAEYRQPLAAAGTGIVPGEPGTSPGGLPYPGSAAREGGPHNGVLTAAEEFVASDDRLRLAVVPAFFGLGAIWDASAPWASAVAEILAPWDANPLLARLEANRVRHIAGEHALRVQLWKLQERQARQEQVLGRLLQSSAFRVAERLSRLRVRAGIAPAQSVISRDEVRQALEG